VAPKIQRGGGPRLLRRRLPPAINPLVLAVGWDLALREVDREDDREDDPEDVDQVIREDDREDDGGGKR
jgi:hypothetical protein